MRKLLALDQSTRTTGYAIYEEQDLIAYGRFTFDDSDIDIRLVKIRNKIIELINQYNINEVVYEEIYDGSEKQENLTTFKKLAEVYGVISELFQELGIKHSTVYPKTWKSHNGIKGKLRPEQKKNTKIYVENKFDIKVSEDEGDAICIGLYKVEQK